MRTFTIGFLVLLYFVCDQMYDAISQHKIIKSSDLTHCLLVFAICWYVLPCVVMSYLK